MSTKIIQVTDLHVAGEGESPRGADVRSNLVRVLAAVAAEKPDYVVISGDLSYRDGDKSAYDWIRAQLAVLSCPWFVIAGNHDISRNLAESFDAAANLHESTAFDPPAAAASVSELYYTKSLGTEFGSLDAIFLDTARSTMSAGQLAWLARILQVDRQRAPIVFMHHPPYRAGCRYMDEHYPFRSSGEFLTVVRDARKPVAAVFCGHYHAEVSIQEYGVPMYITPSLWFQIDRTAAEMKIESYRVGYRIIEPGPEGIATEVVYLSGE